MTNKKKLVFLFFLILLSFHPFIQRNKVDYSVHSKKNINNIEPSLSDRRVGSYLVPGVSEKIPLNQILKIGVLCDLNHYLGDSMWMGAKLAAKEINKEGGILINGTQFYIGLISEDTNEGRYPVILSEGIEAAEKMINDYQPHFITGGHGPDITPHLDVVMDNKTPFIVTGTPFETLSQYVLENYERYKYFFRISPLNGTYLVTEFIQSLIYFANYLNITHGGIVNKIAILREDWKWTEPIRDTFKLWLPIFGLTVIKDIKVPLNATSADFATYWDQIEAAEAQITLTLLLNHTQSRLMADQYQTVKPHCLLYEGANIDGSLGSYWDDCSGACQFAIVYQGIYNTSKTSLTIPFFNSYVKEYGTEPIYTGVASYDAVYLLAHAVEDAQTYDSDTIVTTLEKINASNPLTGAGGNGAFTKSHDIRGGWPLGHALLTQWKYIDGTKVVIPCSYIYPNSIATDSLRLPYWGINGLLTDPPDPPGEFSLETNTGNHDKDGKFNLSWTNSEGADNYSIYMSNKNITYISKKFDLLVYQTSASSFSISGLKEGDYYFVIVAYNKTGETMSTNVVHVRIPDRFPYEIVILVVIIIVVGVIPSGMLIVKRKPFRKNAISKKGKQVMIVEKHKKPKSVDSSTDALKSQELDVMQEIEEELGIEKEEHSCGVHGGKIVGAIYICPSCKTYYCMECASDLKLKGKTCQVCKHEIEL